MNLDTKMIPRRILLTIITILMLLSTFAFAKPDSASTRNDTIAIEVLEERVKGNAENTDIRLESIQNEMRVKTESLRDRIDIYLGVAVILVTLLGLVGYTTIRKWTRDRFEKMASTVFDEGLADLKKRVTQLTDQGVELATKAEKQRREIDRQAQELFEKYSIRDADRDKSDDAVDTDDLTEYMEKLAETKTKEQYTAHDWFLLAYEADERGDFEEAVRGYTSSINLDRNHAMSYSNRGAALCELGRYEDALISYAEALEIIPSSEFVLLNHAEVGILLGQYGDALLQTSRILDTSEDGKIKASSLYLKCITMRLLDLDTSGAEAEFERVLKEDIEVTWSFGVIEKWLEKADISDDTREFIKAKTAMFKAKKKKP